MNHTKAFLIKFISSLVLLYIILGVIYNMSLWHVFSITLVLGVISYILGDLIILPRTNNTVATISDFVLAFVLIWAMSKAFGYDRNTFTISLIASIGVAIFEFFYHLYVSKNVVNKKQPERRNQGNLQYQTESSEEIYPVTPKRNNEEEKDK
jgi:hypothetical protein